jgi:multidrug efflux pump subunit AcrB
VKPVEIDDVPIVLLALWSRSGRTGGDALRRIGDEILDKLAGVRNAGRSAVFGGERRRVLVYLDPARLAARNLAPADVTAALGLANVNCAPGDSSGRDAR